MVAGFSEYDTFRSNQIREGMLTRVEALELVNEENRPRYESLKWYLVPKEWLNGFILSAAKIIGLDFPGGIPLGETVIKRINQIPKLY